MGDLGVKLLWEVSRHF